MCIRNIVQNRTDYIALYALKELMIIRCLRIILEIEDVLKILETDSS